MASTQFQHQFQSELERKFRRRADELESSDSDDQDKVREQPNQSSRQGSKRDWREHQQYRGDRGTNDERGLGQGQRRGDAYQVKSQYGRNYHHHEQPHDYYYKKGGMGYQQYSQVSQREAEYSEQNQHGKYQKIYKKGKYHHDESAYQPSHRQVYNKKGYQQYQHYEKPPKYYQDYEQQESWKEQPKQYKKSQKNYRQEKQTEKPSAKAPAFKILKRDEVLPPQSAKPLPDVSQGKQHIQQNHSVMKAKAQEFLPYSRQVTYNTGAQKVEQLTPQTFQQPYTAPGQFEQTTSFKPAPTDQTQFNQQSEAFIPISKKTSQTAPTGGQFDISSSAFIPQKKWY